MKLDDFIVREFGYAIAILISKLKEEIGDYESIDIDEAGLINLVKLKNANKLMEECKRFNIVSFIKDGKNYKDIKLNLKDAHYVKYIGFVDDISGYYIKHPEHYTKKAVVYIRLLKELGTEKGIIATQVYIKSKQKGGIGILNIKDIMDLIDKDREETEKILEELQKEIDETLAKTPENLRMEVLSTLMFAKVNDLRGELVRLQKILEDATNRH